MISNLSEPAEKEIYVINDDTCLFELCLVTWPDFAKLLNFFCCPCKVQNRNQDQCVKDSIGPKKMLAQRFQELVLPTQEFNSIHSHNIHWQSLEGSPITCSCSRRSPGPSHPGQPSSQPHRVQPGASRHLSGPCKLSRVKNVQPHLYSSKKTLQVQ